jgi:CheY-like chemotaxis protein
MLNKSLDILLVEDNEGDVEMVQEALDGYTPSCNLFVVKDGREALDYLFRHGKFFSVTLPSLILLDLNMSGMDGIILLKIIKDDERLKTIPVVVLTSSKAPSDIQEAYARHANCYVVKPFDGKEFIRAVRQIIQFWNVLVELPYVAATLTSPVVQDA